MKPGSPTDRPGTSWRNANIMGFFDDAGDERVFYQGMSDLHTLATNFIKRTYLEDLITLPRMQDVPDEAFLINPACPVFVSHHWSGPYRPDNRTLDAIRAFIPDQDEVGLWIDYSCLPQKRQDGTDDRTEGEKRFFKSQLQYIPTILLKSQTVVLWGAESLTRAWCVIELILADIFKNVIMKQIYHCQHQLSDPVLYVTQTYNPTELCVTGGVSGTPVAKILLPHKIKDYPSHFYNFLLQRLKMPPTLLTTLLGKVEPEQIGQFFRENQLRCTNDHDIAVLKELLLKVCKFAGGYDVTTIKWPGVISCKNLLPYIMANTSDFSVRLVDYQF